MVKVITKIGNSQGLIMDQALLEMAHLKVGDTVDVSVHDGGSVVLTPCRAAISPEEAKASARRLIGKNSKIFRRLS
jgi:antitoxin component of MazEF toxin-antitoxin module